MSSLRKKLAIAILAGICSAIFSFAIPVAMAEEDSDPDEQTTKVPSWCEVGDPDGLLTKIEENTETATKEELETCFDKVADKAIETSTDADPTVYNKMNTALEELSTAILSKDATIPVKEHVETVLKITDMMKNPCITPDDANNIIAVVEEPIETELTNTDQTKVRTCTRNTFCVRREEKKEQECITYLNAKKSGEKYEPFCSTEASNYMKDNPGDASLYCQPVQVFLSSTGTGLLFTYISTIYKWAASVIGIVAVLVIVISGIQISAAAGDQQAVTNAKNRIVQTLGGLALLFLSAIILYTINPTFFTAGQ